MRSTASVLAAQPRFRTEPDGGGILHVNSVDVVDTAGATWAVAATSGFICSTCLPAASRLHFDVPVVGGNPPPALAGDFTVTTGTLDVEETFGTTGRLTHNSGTIDVASTASCTFDD